MDLKELGENLGLELDEFVEIVKLFVSTADSDIEKIKNAVYKQDAQSASEAAHSLKGSAGNLGFKDMSDIALNAEKNASENNLKGFEDVTKILTEKLNEVKSLLQNI